MASASNFKTLKTCPKREYLRTVSLKELINATLFDDVWNAMEKWFPNQKTNKYGYLETYVELKEMKPKKFFCGDNYYLATKISFDDEGKSYIDAYLRKRGNSISKYAIDLMDWENLLYCNIDPVCYNINGDVTIPEIVAAALYEMTFFGYSLKERKEKLRWTNIA